MGPVSVQSAFVRMGPWRVAMHIHTLAHQAHNRLLHRTITWAPMILVSRTAAGPFAQIGPWCECNSIVDKLDLAHGRSKEIMCKHRHGPISCTVIYTQAACIGPSGTQWAAAQDYHMGPYDFSQWDSCQPYAWIGPWYECNSIVDKLNLAHSRSKETMCKHRHGPISCTVIYTQAACIGPSSTQWAAV